jgi:hypothetical protein
MKDAARPVISFPGGAWERDVVISLREMRFVLSSPFRPPSQKGLSRTAADLGTCLKSPGDRRFSLFDGRTGEERPETISEDRDDCIARFQAEPGNDAAVFPVQLTQELPR